MPPDDFTVDQANDLAHYFLGLGWTADITSFIFSSLNGSPCMLREENKPLGAIHRGISWREVFRAAGVQLPFRTQYIAQGVRVMLADRAICTAVSNTLAKRIAAALNNHIPDRRGI